MCADPVAAIDLGSNTVRLLVASPGDKGMVRHIARQEVARLGEALKPGADLLPAAVERTMTVLREYRADIESAGAGKVLLGATMAVREAADGRFFLDRIREELGFETLVLTGDMEAKLTAAGVGTVLDPVPETAVIFDLGGRSTEFVLSLQGLIPGPRSVWMLGAVALTEAHG